MHWKWYGMHCNGGIALYGMHWKWYGMVWYALKWYGMHWQWYGMVWYALAMVCNGMVWYWHCKVLKTFHVKKN
jgi:hypothetical protein